MTYMPIEFGNYSHSGNAEHQTTLQITFETGSDLVADMREYLENSYMILDRDDI